MPINIGGSRPDVMSRSEDRGEYLWEERQKLVGENEKGPRIARKGLRRSRMLGQKMMRCGSRIIRDKVSRKGRGKDRRGIIK